MKKILFVAGVALIGFSAAFAQEVKQSVTPSAQQSRAVDPNGGGTRKIEPEKIAQRKTERLDKQLSLTADQKQKAYAIFLKDAEANKGRAAFREETEGQIKSILTTEQNAKLEELKEERKRAALSGGSPTRAADQKTTPASK